MARGPIRGARKLSQSLGLAMGLRQAQADDVRNEGTSSPLDLPQVSYTQADKNEGVEGMPSTVMEMQEQRQREQRMAKSAEHFVGAPVAPGASQEPTPASEQQANEEAPQEQIPEAPQYEEAQTAQAQAADMSALQLQEHKRMQALAEQGMEGARRAQKATIEGRRKHLQKLWDFVEGAQGVSSPSILTFFGFILMANVRMFNHVTFKNYDLIPEPTIPQMGCTMYTDIVMCCNILPTCGPGCVGVIVVFMLLKVFAE